MLGGLLRILVVGLVALVAALMLMPRASDLRPEPQVATLLDAPRPLPEITLTDTSGEAFAFSALEGRPSLVFFGFTNCPDICPITLGVIAEAVAQLRANGVEPLPHVVFVSVDPARDSPQRIRAYLNGFDAGFIGVTADDATLAPLLETMAVSIHKEQIDGQTYNVVHNGTIYVLDASARWLALFGGSTHNISDIVDDYSPLLAAAE